MFSRTLILGIGFPLLLAACAATPSAQPSVLDLISQDARASQYSCNDSTRAVVCAGAARLDHECSCIDHQALMHSPLMLGLTHSPRPSDP
jgi:hypothetical protein